MLASIELSQILTLMTIHALTGIVLILIGWFLLPKQQRIPLAIALLLMWGWSAAALTNFYLQDFGFFSWFLDPSQEKNLPALINATLLILLSLSAFALFLYGEKTKIPWHRYYWLLLTALFAFLAADEYFSLHEGITFWRGGYLILGGATGLLGFWIVFTGEAERRYILLMFLIGLGVMGVSGVVLDAFSTQNLLDIGPIEFPWLSCRGEFLGVQCRDYGNTEELMELYGTSIMWLSLMAMGWRTVNTWQKPRRWILAGSSLWLVTLVAWMWLLPTVEATTAQSTDTQYEDLTLIAYDISRQHIAADDTLNVTLYMRANQALEVEYSMSVHLYTQALPDVQSITQDDMTLGEFVYPTRAWIPNLAVRNTFQLDIPDDLESNSSYQLVAILWQETPNNRIPIQQTDLAMLGDGTTLIIDGIAAPPAETSETVSTTSYDFALGFQLTDYQFPETAAQGEEVSLEFQWHTSNDIDLPLTHYLHWIHTETNEVVVFDQIPQQGRFPTQDWVSGMSLNDSWAITLPDDMPTGTYSIYTGMYDTNTVERIPVTDPNSNPVQDNSIVLGEITVVEP